MDRKEIVKALETRFGVKSKYLGAPSFAYQLKTEDETYTIDRKGKIITAFGEEIKLEKLFRETKNEKVINDNIEIQNSEGPNIEIFFKAIFPMEGHSGRTLRNLVNMIYSKQALIKKAFEIEEDLVGDDFSIGINEVKIETLEDFKTALEDIGERSCQGIEFDFYDKTITFKFLQGEENPEKKEVFKQFVSILNQNAKKLKYASAKVKPTDNEKYTFRTWLLRLGMIGDEYKVARKELLKNLSGNGAFRKVQPKDINDVEKNN
ncbi:virulence-related protein [Paramaledivibacter caminithermalis]|jgi:molybdopterin converting factor small subunit|uniref:Intein N-terminal splicing region n=1 Tax=Paramaledivibacter caminithermalis (strain DSM 15212 / CIP 107654 / DViRD3) TaxID=1121301 RepID=A0A1M6S9Z6_PARC5|nr:virulence-related protein [Paramaledivibacter caminithermalis]SHK41525.1 intein N-terminal splicing region [Paramaledivibacter caminithermalis DSM 15212]